MSIPISFQYLYFFFLLGITEQQSTSNRPSKVQESKKKLGDRMNDYSSSFTVHGLSWICTSANIVEKLFWTAAMLGVVGFAFYMVSGYLTRYLSFDLRTEIRNIESPILPLPTMIFCLQAITYQVFGCYRNVNFAFGGPCNISVAQSTQLTYTNYTTGETKLAKYIGSGCHVINENGSLSLLGTGNGITLNFTALLSDSKVHFVAISPEEYSNRNKKVLPFDRFLFLNPGEHELNILQTDITRLTLPYVTNCTNKNLSPNPFSALYSGTTCVQACLMRIWLANCGDVPDTMQRFVNEGTYTLKNMSEKKRRDCMFEALSKINTLVCDCPLACRVKKYEPVIRTTRKLHNKSEWLLNIYNEDNQITQITEVPAYTLEDCLGDVGGILGLAIGASSLSVVELIVYLVLCVARRLR